MAKHSATERSLEKLHAQLARVFTKTLKSYETRMAVLDKIENAEEVNEELLESLVDMVEPSPALLSAVAKFLKDNDIMYTPEEVNELTAQEKRLAEMRKARSGSASLAGLKLVENE